MQLLNFTPFPNLRFYNTDQDGNEFGVLLVKGTFAFDRNYDPTIAAEQAPIVLTDKYHGAVNTSSLWIPSDLVPRKPRTDIILNAVARPPRGRALPRWTCELRILGEHAVRHAIRVTGPRSWMPQWVISDAARAFTTRSGLKRAFRGWRMGEPEPTTEVPIRYELAFGGTRSHPPLPGADPVVEAYEANPIGRGWIGGEAADRHDPIPAPQIEAVDHPVVDPTAAYAPEGFGPIPPAWLPRRPLGGTFDGAWKENRWPNWPADYSFAYHNSAHPALVYPQFLAGDEVIQLAGFHETADPVVIVLTGDRVTVSLQADDGRVVRKPMNLDTLVLDIADADPAEHRMFVSWRVDFDPDTTIGAAFKLDRPDVFERASRQLARVSHVD